MVRRGPGRPPKNKEEKKVKEDKKEKTPRFLGPPSGDVPLYNPATHQDMMAHWNGKWYPIVLLREPTLKIDRQWMYDVRWIGYSNSAESDSGMSRVCFW